MVIDLAHPIYHLIDSYQHSTGLDQVFDAKDGIEPSASGL